MGKASLRRALRILDTLLKALADRGIAVHLAATEQDTIHLVVGPEKVQFCLAERFKRIDHVLTVKEQADRKRWPSSWVQK